MTRIRRETLDVISVERLTVATFGLVAVAVPVVHAVAVLIDGIPAIRPVPVALVTVALALVTALVHWIGARPTRTLIASAAATAVGWGVSVSAGWVSTWGGAAFGLAIPVFGLGIAFVTRRGPRRLDGALRRRPVLGGAWALLALVALAQLVRLSSFMVDPALVWGAAFPFDAASVRHMCLAAYVRAAEIVQIDPATVYDPALYREGASTSVPHLEPYLEDVYLYPPPFLILPVGALELLGDFFRIRTVWFALQVLFFTGSALAAARWIGGRIGLTLGLLVPALWASVPFLFATQYGQFHLMTLASAMLGMMFLESRRWTLGGALVSAAVWAKISPGILGVELLARRRLRAVAAVLVAGLVFALAALALFGPVPYLQYLDGRLLEIAQAEAAFDEMSLLALANDMSIASVVRKIGRLGVPGMTVTTASGVSWAYTVALLLLAFVAGRKMQGFLAITPAERLRRAQIWLGLLNLAVLRSPVAPGVYVLTGTLWLLTLAMAEPDVSRARVGAGVVVWLFFMGVPPVPSETLVLLISLTTQGLCIGVNAWAVLRSSLIISERELSASLPASDPVIQGT